MTLSRATPRQRAVLIAYIRHGSIKRAAQSLGINENTARSRLKYMCQITGAKSVVKAAYLLGLETPR